MTAEEFNDQVWQVVHKAREEGMLKEEILTELDTVMAGLEDDGKE